MSARAAALTQLGSAREQATRVAVVAALSATAMLFASLASAYLVRRSLPDWRPSADGWPLLLLALALLASLGVEAAVRSTGRQRRPGLLLLGGASAAYLLAVLMVVSSIATDASRIAAPHQAFVALLLGLHGLHALVATLFSQVMLRDPGRESSDPAFSLARLVTHFLTALLCAILFLLFVLR